MDELSARNDIRNSNIEMLRIVSMIFIVMGHFVDQTTFLTFDFNINNVCIAALGLGARIATNIFLIISVWFLCDSDFNAKRAIKLYSQLFFYSYILTTVAVIIGGGIGFKDIARGYMPFFGRALWFASAYISLYLLSPVLKKFFSLDMRLQKAFCLISFVLVCLVSTLPDEQNGYLIDFIWFIFVYLWIGTFKHMDVIKIFRWFPSLILGIGIYVVLIGGYFCSQSIGNGIVSKLINVLGIQYIHDIKTLPNFLCAFLISMSVLTMKTHRNGLINKIASYSFSVYLFHQVPAFIQVLWTNIFNAEMLKRLPCGAVVVVLVGIVVYGMASIVEAIRLNTVDKIFMKSKFVNKLCYKIDDYYGVKNGRNETDPN